jgi:hypothetical protein
MLGKFLCQSLVSPTGLALASLAHLRAFYGKDMSQKNEVLFDKQQIPRRRKNFLHLAQRFPKCCEFQFDV